MTRFGEIAVPMVMRMLRHVPFVLAERILIALSLGQAIVEPGRLRRAHAWAARGGAAGRRPWAVVLGLLVHRGRVLAASPITATLSPTQARERLEVRGLERLDETRRTGGVLLLGFHVGLVGAHHWLALLGYEITAIEEDRVRWPVPPPAWRASRARTRIHWWTRALPGSRADALYRLRQAAVAGGISMIMGTAGLGRVLCELPVPGRPLVIRAGWFALRRTTGLPVLPVLGHWEDGRWVVTIYPALPAPLPDEQRDREACRDALTRLLVPFVSRYPEQCVQMAMHVDAEPVSSPGGSRPEPS
jgi:lauroyl/myristoyl acyltransferase